MTAETTDKPRIVHMGAERPKTLGWSFPLRLLAQAAIVSIAVVVVTFFLIRLLPGDPAQEILGPQASPEAVAALRQELGLDSSLPAQFAGFVSNVVHGDLGGSLSLPGTSVSSLVMAGLANTLVLIISSIAVSVIASIALGMAAAVSQRRWVDKVIRLVSMVSLAAPSAFVGLLAILFVSVKLGMAPAGGWGDSYPDNLEFMWLPVLVLSFHLAPILLRAIRERARSVLREQHIEAALTRGMGSKRLILFHLLPNSALPVITLVGLSLGSLVSGAVVIEAVFGIPGIGSTLVRAVGLRDYPVVQGVALVSGIVVVLGNLIAELVQRLIDPRLRP